MKWFEMQREKYWQLVLIGWVVSLFVFTAGVAHLDYIVHHEFLQHYGLEFRWEWAIRWWVSLGVIYVFVGALCSLSYWFLRASTLRHRVTGLLIGFTVISMAFGGIFDVVVYGLFAPQDFPGLETRLWWTPFEWLFGLEWTGLRHYIWILGWTIAIVVCWVIWFYTIGRKHTR